MFVFLLYLKSSNASAIFVDMDLITFHTFRAASIDDLLVRRHVEYFREDRGCTMHAPWLLNKPFDFTIMGLFAFQFQEV